LLTGHRKSDQGRITGTHELATYQMNPKQRFTHRVAQITDIPCIIDLMQLSIAENMKAFLTTAEIEAAKETMGVDRSLIEDATYFLIEAKHQDTTTLVGCGGWGKRRTLYGGDHTVGRDDSLSNPATDAARIRAMYTHPDWTRQGIGSLTLALGEDAARNAGFKTIELGSTVAGEPLYRARGYIERSRKTQTADNGADNLVITMHKSL
jgi:GNAT superfamily N-acetyltransferase